MVRSHRCPATVCGSKSAGTTEASRFGKVQRVGECREPGDLPYRALRRPFEGKGRQLVWADPDRSRLGFFYACCFPCRVELFLFLPCGGSRGEGKQAVVPPAALPPSFFPPAPTRYGMPCAIVRRLLCDARTQEEAVGCLAHAARTALTRYIGLVCWGCSTVCRRTSTRRRSRMGCLSPWVECLIYAPRARERRRAHATFCVPTRSAVRRLGMGPDYAG